jgi:DNA-binding beta-propeller fold protein YncE
MSELVRHALVALVAVLCVAANFCRAEDAKVDTLLDGLNHPCGIAVRPSETAGRHEIFVAESGAGRVIRVWNDQPKEIDDVVTGFERTPLGEGGTPVGPMGLYFLDRNHLVVGASGGDGTAGLRLYELTDEPTAQSATDAKQIVNLAAVEGDGTAPQREHVYAMTRTHANDNVADSLVVSCFSNDETGELQRIAIRAGTLGKIQRFADARTTPPAAVTTSEQGYVVAGWVGRLDVPHDSQLAFYNPLDGSKLMELAVDLHDILGLAYSPKTGNLYAVDAAWMDTSNGGVFRIDAAHEIESQNAVAVKLASVLRPSAIAFASDGTLYVTAFGELSRDTPTTGILVRIKGDL